MSKLIVNNLYDRDITNLIDNWYYLENGLESLRKEDPPCYLDILKKKIINRFTIAETKSVITRVVSKITSISDSLVINYLKELDYYNPLLFAENNWFESVEMGILYCFVRIYKPMILVETGSNIGHSAFFTLLGIKLNSCGKLFCFDICNLHEIAEEAKVHINQGFCWSDRPIKFNKNYEPLIMEFIPKSLFQYIEFIPGDCKYTLPKFVDEINHIDYFFHDSCHSDEHMNFEYNTVKEKIASGGIFASHDITCKDIWPNFIKNNPNFKSIYQWHTGIAQRI